MNIKRMLFKQGLYTLNVTPKGGDTTKWSVNDWIKFIDENGNWKI
uniref:Phage protein n=1 Tax=Salmonella phage vB_SenS_Jbel TaxID=3236639 RepID=A0AB39AK37_9CAUD